MKLSRLLRSLLSVVVVACVSPLLAADTAASFSYRPLRILSLDLDLMGVFPLVRDRFYFGPNPPVFSIPIAGFSARGGLRVIWP